MTLESGFRRGLPRRTRDRATAIALRIGLLVVVLVAWQLLGDDSKRMAFPTPVRVATSWWRLVTENDLLRALADSNLALLIGYLLALVAGLLLGVVMGTVPIIGRIARPYLTIVIAIPMIAMLPVIQAIFGIELTARVVIVFVFSFVYFAMNTELGVRSAAPELLEMSRSLRATWWQRLTTIVLPQAVPAIAGGARLALGRGIAGMVLGELFLVSAGIGSMLSYFRARFDSGAVFAIALTLVLEGVLLMMLARWIEKRLVSAAVER